MTTIATSTFFNTLISNSSATQARFAEVNLQTSTGLVSIDYAGLGNQAQRLINLDSDLTRLDAQDGNIRILEGRVNSQFGALSNLIDLANNFQADLATATGSVLFATPAEIAAIAQTTQSEFRDLLNTQIAGDYIFAGSATNIPPVDLSDPAILAQTSPSIVDAAYYQGNTQAVNTPIADGVFVNPTIAASEGGFEQVFRALNLVLNNAADPNALLEAINLIDQGIEDITNTRSRVSSNANTLQQQLDINANERNLLAELAGDINAVDIAEATLVSQQLSAQLQASFSASARALSLNLFEFI